MKNRYLIFTNKRYGLINLLDFPDDIDLFNNGNDLCIIHFQKEHWMKNHFVHEDIPLSKLHSINKNKEIIIIVDDGVTTLKKLAPLFYNINNCYAVLHKRTKNSNQEVLDQLGIENLLSNPESHISENFYDSCLRKLLMEEVSDKIIKETHLYFTKDHNLKTDRENQILKSKLKILHEFLQEKDFNLKKINKELELLDESDKAFVTKYYENRNLAQLSEKLLGS